MPEFSMNSQLYNISTEKEVAVILSHFNSGFIFDVIKDNLQKRFNFNSIGNPNVVASFEQNFKHIQSIYPSDFNNIENVRLQTYQEIINILCNEYNFIFNNQQDVDLYSAAFYLYDFLVSNFITHLTSFYANFIIKEKNNLYEAFNMEQFKKNKDSSTLYNKKIYKDTKIAVLNANLEYVIRNMSTFDIKLSDILNNIYYDKTIVGFIDSIACPTLDFFKTYYCSMLNSDMFPVILTNIRLEIQKISSVE